MHESHACEGGGPAGRGFFEQTGASVLPYLSLNSSFEVGARRAGVDKWLRIELSVETNFFQESPLNQGGNEEYYKFYMNYSG